VTAGKAASGAGINSSHGLVLHRVAVVGNEATGDGGGISVDGTAGEPLLIDHSLIADNQATGAGGLGGGMLADSDSVSSAIVDSTIAGNTATGTQGGGFLLEAGTLFLDGDTVVGNSLTGVGGQGGNFRVHADTVKMRNTILAGGTAAAGGDCYLSSGGHLISLGHNAEDTDATPDSDCQDALVAAGDRKGLTLQLGALQNNGGPTDTMLPAAGSPVLDAGDPSACQPDDQRGVTRPQAGGCDIGAVERSIAAIAGTFADGVSTSGAALHAAVNTAGLAGTARFAYGPTTAYGAFSAPVALGALASVQGAAAQLGGLQAGTTYHFRLEVTTVDGTFTGADAAFTTAKPPAPKPRVSCHVPKLKGKTLAAARRALKKAHCALGKVHKPHHAHGRLVVRRQSPSAGKVRRAGTRVAVTLRAVKKH